MLRWFNPAFTTQPLLSFGCSRPAVGREGPIRQTVLVVWCSAMHDWKKMTELKSFGSFVWTVPHIGMFSVVEQVTIARAGGDVGVPPRKYPGAIQQRGAWKQCALAIQE
eukprot:6136951-Amphidinium_carterae.1